jgi:hypothetical protein
MAGREFRSKRDTRPPTQFTIYFEVPKVEKVPDPEQEGGYLEREVEPPEWVEESRTFHYLHKIPGALTLRIQAGNDIRDMQANGDQAAAIRELLDMAIVEQEQFRELMDDPRAILETDVLPELVQAIIDDSSQRDPSKPRT